MKKKILEKKALTVVLSVLMLMGGITGCGAKNDASDSAGATTTTQQTDATVAEQNDGDSALLKSIKEKGYITIASSNDAPLCYQDIETGELAGIDIMIFNEICKRMGIPEIKMSVIDFSNMLVELNNKSVDMVVDAMYIKDERLDVALFTDVWYQEGEAVVVKRGSSFTTKESLVDATMGAQPGTAFYETAEGWLKDNKIKELVGFENQATLMTAVNTGKIDAAVTDGIVLAYTLSQDSNLDLEMISPYESEAAGRIGAAVRFEDKDFLEEVNAVLNEMKEDGTLLQILKDFGLNEDYFVGVEDGKTANKK